jgi:hypothetical protein
LVLLDVLGRRKRVAAERAGRVKAEPLEDALIVESVGAWHGPELVLSVEILEAHRALRLQQLVDLGRHLRQALDGGLGDAGALVGSCVVGGNRRKITSRPVVVAEAFDQPLPPGPGPVTPAINHMGTIHIVMLHWHLHPSFHMSSSNNWIGEEALLTDRSATPLDIGRARLRLRVESDFGLRFRAGSPAPDETNGEGDGYGRRDPYICWATPADTAHHLLGRQISQFNHRHLAGTNQRISPKFGRGPN